MDTITTLEKNTSKQTKTNTFCLWSCKIEMSESKKWNKKQRSLKFYQKEQVVNTSTQNHVNT